MIEDDGSLGPSFSELQQAEVVAQGRGLLQLGEGGTQRSIIGEDG